MLQRLPRMIAVRAVMGMLLFASAAPALAATPTCDRACLTGLIDQYVDALVAQDPRRLALASQVRFTEDSQELPLGEGLWKTKLTKGGFRQDYLDLRAQVAATHVELREGSQPVLLSVVLQVEDRRLTGIETLVQRITPQSRFQPTELGKPLPRINDPVPADQQQSRDGMIRTALTYTEGIRIGSFVNAPTPFGPQAYRIENGMFMAGAGCPRAQCPDILTQRIIPHPDTIASVAAVDEENGVVLLWMSFGDTNSYGPGNALVTLEAFKVWGGQIHVVHAFFRTLPVTTQRNWPSLDADNVPAPGSIEARLRRMEDEQAIARVLLEYGRTLDARDFAAYSALFAADGQWIGALGTFKGPAEIKTAMERIFAGATDIPKGSNFHAMSNFDITVQGERALAKSVFVFYIMDGNKPVAEVAGRYEDVLVRIGGVWKFLTRTALPPG
jgi:ketosteroid isomerase-like protein